MKMTNRWNHFIYRLWAPIYDAALGRFFLPGRLRALEVLNLQPEERVLLVGVGTGGDLPLLPEGISATGVDLSAEMLERARRRLPLPGRSVELIQGDARQLLVAEGVFDAVIFNLVLSVIPDPDECLRKNLRALKPGGRAVIFDKFLPDAGRLTLGRRLLNLGSTLLGTDITRRFGDISRGAPIRVLKNEPSILNGMYRVILLEMSGE